MPSGTQTVTVSSSSGTFRDTCAGNVVLGTAGTPLSSTKVETVTTTHTFSESVLVPPDISTRANKLGLSSFVFQRTFTSSGPPVSTASPCVTMNVTSAAAAGLGISREALSFDNGAAVRVLPVKDPLQALAEVSFTGTGLLQGQWEVAGPTSTVGEPIFRPLAQVRQYLAAGETHTFRSPPLPTDVTGIYLVRLRITEPVLPFEAPVIRYFVAQGRPGKELPAQPLTLGGPPDLALLAPDTNFAWEAIKGARAYQLEIYATGRDLAAGLPDLGGGDRTPKPADVAGALSRPPVTGLLVPGKQTRVPLSAMARQHLLPGRAYLWRVLAIGEDGTIIGASPMRELRTP
jgi:hypothetical protein